MANRQIDERMVVSDSYSFFGELPVLPERPELVRVEVRRLTKPEVLKKFRWTDEQFLEAQVFNFPVAGKLPRFLNWGVDLVWKEDALDRWASEQREKATVLLRLVG